MLTSTYHAITPGDGRLCHWHAHRNAAQPATWEHRWRTETMPASAFEDLCEGCASELRRREVDRELREIGARVIQVQDLGAALEARWVGGMSIDWITGLSMMTWSVRDAAHLARLALGEG